ncbi:MAG: hypothetical protein QE271_03960 [Bacteriovoracaceae bacterium]|nr:hypothetical protein [Bacteriovoracaceae bacterium]
MQRWKIWTVLILLGSILGGYYLAFHYPISTGKRVGNLTKLSVKGKLIKTWEGTLNEGYGDKLTTYFSINSEKLAQELYAHEGREVVIYYEEHFYGWPNDTNYNVIKWHAQGSVASTTAAPIEDNTKKSEIDSLKEAIKIVANEWQMGLFCSLLGTLVSDQDLYKKVKEKVQQNNPFLAEQIKNCNSK